MYSNFPYLTTSAVSHIRQHPFPLFRTIGRTPALRPSQSLTGSIHSVLATKTHIVAIGTNVVSVWPLGALSAALTLALPPPVFETPAAGCKAACPAGRDSLFLLIRNQIYLWRFGRHPSLVPLPLASVGVVESLGVAPAGRDTRLVVAGTGGTAMFSMKNMGDLPNILPIISRSAPVRSQNNGEFILSSGNTIVGTSCEPVARTFTLPLDFSPTIVSTTPGLTLAAAPGPTAAAHDPWPLPLPQPPLQPLPLLLWPPPPPQPPGRLYPQTVMGARGWQAARPGAGRPGGLVWVGEGVIATTVGGKLLISRGLYNTPYTTEIDVIRRLVTSSLPPACHACALAAASCPLPIKTSLLANPETVNSILTNAPLSPPELDALRSTVLHAAALAPAPTDAPAAVGAAILISRAYSSFNPDTPSLLPTLLPLSTTPGTTLTAAAATAAPAARRLAALARTDAAGARNRRAVAAGAPADPAASEGLGAWAGVRAAAAAVAGTVTLPPDSPCGVPGAPMGAWVGAEEAGMVAGWWYEYTGLECSVTDLVMVDSLVVGATPEGLIIWSIDWSIKFT